MALVVPLATSLVSNVRYVALVVRVRILQIPDLVITMVPMRTKFWSENLEGKDHSEDIGVDGKILLRWMFGKHDGKVWTGYI